MDKQQLEQHDNQIRKDLLEQVIKVLKDYDFYDFALNGEIVKEIYKQVASKYGIKILV
jgi:hypothetical protein